MFDLIVIGAGSGGVRAARIAAGFGAKVAIVEERFFGGTCVNVGCVPKKLFSYGASFGDLFRLAEDYGYALHSQPAFSWDTLRDNKTREIERLNGVYQRMLEGAGVQIFSGRGVITAADKVRVGEQIIQGRHILIATGGKPFVPDIPGGEHILISDDLFSLPALPKRVAVIGGGYIACEFASILNGLGCQVHQIYRGDLFLRGFDQEVREFVAGQVAHRGVELHFSTDVRSITANDRAKQLHLEDGSVLEVDAVFYATGRVPYVDGLFEGISPALGVNGALQVDETFRTSVPGVYAVGDVIDRVQLTPVALAEGMWLARHLFAPQQAGAAPEYDFIPTAVFCHPNIGTVGLSQELALEKHGTIRVYCSEFRGMKYSLGEVQHRSLMKLIVDDVTDEVIGLHVVGDDAGEIVQGFAVAIRSGATKADFDRTIGIHPTAAEELVTMRQGKVVQ
ncbi:glutathione-disulfide reductase [Alcanivorax sp. 1008]|uniref:glutathione-disulfide reductase n=1 Tax=Alcanivorax sp. 1008 TaxID=2816853 RepID=UPI001DA6797A|nr:glutathione-disulfide reductase [Alcanivorax sp. 1008]MCC1498027.1 glutathione-disulfide reductase [Alcanivorax sp. 1008]